ncbi:MAG: hypothetical protein Q8R96_16415 [Bacteroidota bacterium]|nr:hypothetical protein [Bacteroidota bacterium]
MKTRILTFTLLSLLMIFGTNLSAQNRTTGSESYGGTFNAGLGIGGYYGYYNYVGRSMPVFSLNYEFDVAKNFTLAPFVTFLSYRNDKYYYRETVMPLGVKGSYYLDQALNANSNWDFYIAGSLGFTVVNTRWDDGYKTYPGYRTANPLFLDLHLGAEYHLSNHVGLFLDLSTGVSTIGLSFK